MSVLDGLRPYVPPSPRPPMPGAGSSLLVVPTWVWLVLSLALVAGIALQFAVRGWRHEERAALLVIPVALASFSLIFLGGLVGILVDDWPADRLAATFAIVKGYRLFYGPHDGPILNFLYGPIAALVYLPATLASTPTPAILIGGFINAALFFVPIPWLVSRLDGRGPHPWLWMTAAATACAIAFVSSTFAVFAIHADAPAQCFALLACIPLVHRRPEDTARDFSLSGLFLALAVWSKQIVVPLAVALPLFLWLSEGWPACKAYLTRAIPIGLIVSLALVLAFDPEKMIFNMLVIPSHHPWDPPGLEGFIAGTREMVDAAHLYLLALAVLPFADRESWSHGPGAWRRWLRRHPWTLFVLAAVLLTPTCVVSRIKLGGLANSFYSNYLLIAGVIVGWAEVVMTTRRAAMRRLGCAILLVIAAAGIYARSNLWERLPLWQRARENSHEIAYRLAKRYPRQIFFPWQTLSTLLADGDLTHFAYGLYDRELAGFAPSAEHFRAHLPKSLQAIGYFNSDIIYDEMVKKYLPEFTLPMVDDEIPNLVLWTRDPQR